MLIYITVKHKELGIIQDKVVFKVNKNDSLYNIGKKCKEQICKEESDRNFTNLDLFDFELFMYIKHDRNFYQVIYDKVFINLTGKGR